MVFRLSLWVLFYDHGLRSPAALQKLLHRFSAAYALIQRIAKQKIRRKIFAAAVADASTWLVLRCEPKKSLHNLRA